MVDVLECRLVVHRWGDSVAVVPGSILGGWGWILVVLVVSVRLIDKIGGASVLGRRAILFVFAVSCVFLSRDARNERPLDSTYVLIFAQDLLYVS